MITNLLNIKTTIHILGEVKIHEYKYKFIISNDIKLSTVSTDKIRNVVFDRFLIKYFFANIVRRTCPLFLEQKITFSAFKQAKSVGPHNW